MYRKVSKLYVCFILAFYMYTIIFYVYVYIVFVFVRLLLLLCVLYTGGWTRSQYYDWMVGFLNQLLWVAADNTATTYTTTLAASSGSRLMGSPIRGQQQRADGNRNNIVNNTSYISSSSVPAVDVGMMLSCLTKLIAYDPIVSNLQYTTSFL